MSERKMLVVTCMKCRAWYSMDYEWGLPDEHYDMRTGEECIAGDEDWYIIQVPYREEWKYAY